MTEVSQIAATVQKRKEIAPSFSSAIKVQKRKEIAPSFSSAIKIVKIRNVSSRVRGRSKKVGLQAVLQKVQRVRDRTADRLRSNSDRHTGNLAFCEPMSSHKSRMPSHKTRTVDVKSANMIEPHIRQRKKIR